jgi:hypothetical protein
MTKSSVRKNGFIGFISLLVVFAVLGCGTMISNANAPVTNIAVTNNSGRTIAHIYLSPPDNDNWGPDQLNNSSLAPGASVTISNASCNQATIKVIAEDSDGCFTSAVIECSENSGWTIASDAARNCGG